MKNKIDEIITVIMPVYKVREKLLRKSIESVLGQSYRNIEFIIVDDGSPDNCGIICEQYARADSRIRIFHKKNSGVSAARNMGLNAASGTYVAFVDADDYISDNYLEVLLTELRQSNADISLCCCKYLNEEQELKKDYPETKFKHISKTINPQAAIEALCYFTPIYPGLEITAVWGKIYRKSIVEGILFDERMSVGEDFIFNYQCFVKSKVIVACNYNGYQYIQCSTGLMKGTFHVQKMKTLNGLRDFWDTNAKSVYTEPLRCRIINIAIVLLLMIPVRQYNKERKKIENFINNHRFQIIKNRYTRKKVKIALLLSYLGYDLMQICYIKLNSTKLEGKI